MIVFRGRNVHALFPRVIQELLRTGVRRDSRNGPVLVFPEPVTTVYEQPAERVLFYPERDANPFFHLAEALWMLGGREDVEFIARYVKRMESYSDDGLTFHGAYGYRWRRHFLRDVPEGYEDPQTQAIDQLSLIIEALRKDPDDRRQVLTMWDPKWDLGRKGKDIPCNLQATFQIAPDGRLDMMVTNRSNDIIWGAYGANAVHFSILHEYMARCIGVRQGIYRQVSANFHAYVEVLDKVKEIRMETWNPYDSRWSCLKPWPLMSTTREVWEMDLQRYLNNNVVVGPFKDPFFTHVAAPMALAYAYHKMGNRDRAFAFVETIKAEDWKVACYEWLNRRGG
jgi:thymidylate synthase